MPVFIEFRDHWCSGDADLYVRYGSQPSTSNYRLSTMAQWQQRTCTISNIQAGTYHVMVRLMPVTVASLGGHYSSTEQTVFSNGSNINIPDNNPAGATSSINATLSGQAGNMAISYNIVHTYRGDLRVQLIAPNGAITTLRNPSGGSTNNLNETIYTNQGSISATGNWQLKVVDIYNQDTGYINSWQIEFL